MTTVTAYLAVDGAARAIDFYINAFGAVEQSRLAMEDGKIGHAAIRIGESALYLSDEWPEMGVVGPAKLTGIPASLVLEVEDPDAVFHRAIECGAKQERPLKDEPYGRGGWVIDPFGHRWNIMRANPSFDPASMG
jgi:PhnB protein